MFSSRLPPHLQPSALSCLIGERRAGGEELLDLTESNPTRAGIVYPVRDILTGFDNLRNLDYNPEPLGLPAARSLIASLHGVSPDRVVLTASTSEAYSWLLKLLCNPEDEILTPRPSYPLFEMLAGLESVTVRQYPLHYFRGWYLDLCALESRITERTRAVVVVNPNNPTGSYLKRQELQDLGRLCAKKNIALVSDEVFYDYSFAPDADRAPSAASLHEPLAFALNGLSKMSGLPQMKLAWITVSGPPAFRHEALQRLEMIADTYLSAGTPVQNALPALLTARDDVQNQIKARLKANLELLLDQLSNTSVSLLHLEGGWTATLRVPGTRSEEEWVTSLLRERGVLVQPGYFYDFPAEAYLIVSLLAREEIFHEGMVRLRDHVA